MPIRSSIQKSIKFKLRHYRDFIKLLLIVIFCIFTPVILLSLFSNIEFDPAEFVNLYSSTLFTSVLIALALQFLDLYRSVSIGLLKTRAYLNSLKTELTTIQIQFGKDNSELSNYEKVLQEFKISFNNVPIVDVRLFAQINSLTQSIDFITIIDSIERLAALSNVEKENARLSAGKLISQINTLESTI